MASKRNRKTRQQEAAARREEIRKQFERQERRRRAIWVAAIIVVLAVIIGSVAWALTKNAADKTAAANGPTGHGGLVAGVGIVHGSSSAPVTVTLYEDFQCPYCKQFETSDGATIDADVTAKQVKVEYRPVAFLTDQSDYSVRALNAAACVKDEQGPAAYAAMHKILFANQPSESGPWPDDSELIKDAVQAGAKKSTVSGCISSKKYESWASKTTDAWSKAGYNSTPIVLVNGKQVSKGVPTTAELKAAIDKAASR
jgi:protein-disulfide isomerase